MLTTIFQQYFLILTLSLALIYFLDSFRFVISLVGSIVILLSISWRLTKYIHRFYTNKHIISSYRKAVLITGCDTGFGNRLAYKLNSCGFLVYATVLNAESNGSNSLRTQTVFPDAMRVIQMDVTNDGDVSKAYEYVSQHLISNGHQLWGIVNNAGVCFTGHIDWGKMKLYEDIVDVNVFGVVRVTRTFLPLIRQSKGRIVNMSSMLGKVAVPLSAGYCMTKYAVRSFSDGLRRELTNWGINVAIIMPSAFKTNIVENFEQGFDNVWNNTDVSVKNVYGQKYFDDQKQAILKITDLTLCEDIDLVVDAIIDALTSVSPKVCYEVTGDWSSYIFVTLIDYIPEEWLDKFYTFMSIK